MLKTQFTLTAKRPLTHDVWELQYKYEGVANLLAGQYVMFQLAPGLNRAYSLSDFRDQTFTLIVKCYLDGKGSPMICQAEVGSLLSGMLGLGHFTLRENDRSKCFIGTGVGFAAVHCQLKMSLEMKQKGQKAFIFGVRTTEDMFYEDEIRKISEDESEFYYFPYLSREEKAGYTKGYVTDWITPENVGSYEEFYICGSPEMVKSAREKLDSFGVSKEDIYFEQF